MTRIKTYTKNNKKEIYNDFEGIFNQLDVYYDPSFLSCDAFMQGGEYEIFTIQKEHSVWIYPYILLPIKETNFLDLSSPYGYAGPFCNDEHFFDEAEQEFVKYIESKPIVSEFIRYHYEYNQSSSFRFKINCQNSINRTIVLLDTKSDFQTIWETAFSGTNRNLVRKLEKENFTWSFEDFELKHLDFFPKMYDATMKNAQASSFYFFSKAFYEELIHQLGDKLKIAIVEKEGVIYSTALFFVCNAYVTYYLSARNLDFPKVTASNFLLSNVVQWAVEHQLKIINFGGGLSNSEEDRLFKFKTNFSKETRTFYIGKRIHKQDVYNTFVENYKLEKGEEAFEKVKNLLQFYR